MDTQVIHIARCIGKSISLRESIVSLFKKLSINSHLTLDFQGVDFLSRTAAQEFVKQISTLQQQNVKVQVVNSNDTVAAVLKEATKKNPSYDWLIVGGILVAAGLLIHHVSSPSQTKKALRNF